MNTLFNMVAILFYAVVAIIVGFVAIFMAICVLGAVAIILVQAYFGVLEWVEKKCGLYS